MDTFKRNGYTNQAYCYESTLIDHDEILADEESDIRWAAGVRSPRREPPIGASGGGLYVEECVPMLSNDIPRKQPVLHRAASIAYRPDRNPKSPPKSLDCSFDGIRHTISSQAVNPRLNQSFTYNSSSNSQNHNTSLYNHSHNHSFHYNTPLINPNTLSQKISGNRVNRNAVSHYDLSIYQEKDMMNSPKWSSPPPLPPPRPPKPTMAIQPLIKPSKISGENYNSRKLKEKTLSKISVYSESSQVKVVAPAPFAALSLSGFVMLFCGVATCALSSYLLSKEGRRYYLDVAMVAGFICFLLGGLAIRPRRFEWLPNRNYVSGYMMVSAFSLLTAATLLVLCTLVDSKSALAAHQVTAGAVAALAGLCILLASLGVLASHCFKYPPPDNRVNNQQIQQI